VQLQWQYPLLDPQDCDPSTYTVSVKLLSADAPSPPSTVTVQGQDGVNLTGLFPDTKYEIVVTAYINKLHTSSFPLVVTTSLEGPAAPSRAHTTVDDAGNWTITWNSCGGVRVGCVPTTDWQIIPHLCDGVGLSATPDTRRRVGDPTQHTFSYTYQGSETLLGRGLSFEVQGIGEKGTIGDSASDGSCSYSWTPTVASDIHIHASAPPMTTGESASHSTISVDFDAGQQHDLGGLGGEMTYELLHAGSVVAKVGPTTKTEMTLPGISAGTTYQAAVTVNPPRHRSVTERIGPVDIEAAVAEWPQPSVSATSSNTSAYFARLAVTVNLPAGTNTHGETFDLSAGSSLRCGNTDLELASLDGANNIHVGDTRGFDIDRTQFNSHGQACIVHIALVQNSGTVTDPPLYGDGTTSPDAQVGVSIDVPSLTAGLDDFNATWNSSAAPGHPQVNVAYAGGDDKFLEHANNWQILISNDGGTTRCGASYSDLSPSNPAVVIDVDRDCITAGGTFTAKIDFNFYGDHDTFTEPVAGSAPTPVDANQFNFTAEFTHPLPVIGKPEVRVEYSGPYDQETLNSLRWDYAVTSDQSPGVECQIKRDYSAPGADGSGPDIALDYQRCPTVVNGTAAIYTLTVSFTDPNYGVTGTYSAQAGSP
jgi:hypothetical protein